MSGCTGGNHHGGPGRLHSPMKTILPFAIITAASIMQSQAVVVWADDFSTARTGTAPNDYSYDADGQNDYSIRAGGTVTTGSGYLKIVDNANPGFSALVTTTQWDSLPQEGEQIVFSYSIRVNSMTAAAAASVPRFGLVQDSTNQDLHNGGGSIFNLGFSYANFDGVAGSELAFYTTADVTNVPAGNGIGYSAGAWAQGFSFGPYVAGTAATIPLYTGAPTTAQWYNVRIVVTEGSTALTGTITQEGTSNSVSFNRTLGTAANFNDLTNANDGFRIFMGDSGSSETDFDNLKVEIIPEPSAALLGAAGFALLLRRRHRSA